MAMRFFDTGDEELDAVADMLLGRYWEARGGWLFAGEPYDGTLVSYASIADFYACEVCGCWEEDFADAACRVLDAAGDLDELDDLVSGECRRSRQGNRTLADALDGSYCDGASMASAFYPPLVEGTGAYCDAGWLEEDVDGVLVGVQFVADDTGRLHAWFDSASGVSEQDLPLVLSIWEARQQETGDD